MDRSSVIAPPPVSRPPTRPKSLAWVALLGIGLVGLGIIAAVTNPSQASYEAYLSHQALQQLKTQLCTAKADATTLGLGQILEQGCQSLLQQGEQPLKQLISYQTTHHNFGVVSLYTTEFPAITEKKIWAVGFLGKIYLLP